MVLAIKSKMRMKIYPQKTLRLQLRHMRQNLQRIIIIKSKLKLRKLLRKKAVILLLLVTEIQSAMQYILQLSVPGILFQEAPITALIIIL